jgi:heme exporter protein A
LSATLLTGRGLRCERDGRLLFDDLAIELHAGEIVELTGPNGSGKTTLLRILAGLSGDFAGAVERRGRLSYIGHRGGLNPQLTALENLRWYAVIEGYDATDAQLLQLLAEVGLAGHEETPCQQLSAGQQRRAALARLGFDGDGVWLLDEPLTALDDDGSAVVRGLLGRHCAAGGAALCATHQSLGVAAARQQALGRH